MKAKTKRKIVLYNPKAVFFDMPLALLAIASSVDRDQFDLTIIDGRLVPNPLQMVIDSCQDAICLGITVLTGSPINDSLSISRAVKSRFPDLPVVWGGWHPSLFPAECLAFEESVDFSVFGQGEQTFAQLVHAIYQGSDFDKINGLAFRDGNGSVRKNPARLLVDMNAFPSVDYSLIDVEMYFRKKGRRQLDYISSTGCRFRCAFCADPFVYGRGWTAISPERMGDEFEFLSKRYQMDDVNFQDETFFTSRKRVTEIANQILSRGIKITWAGTMRADQGARMSEEEFDLCKKSGLRRVLVGVESGSQEMLDWMQKDIRLEQVYLTAERCAVRDIAVIFPFIVGFPEESDENVSATIKVASDLSKMHPNFTTPIFYFKPYPGSKITESVVRNGYRLPYTLEEWADFDYIGSSGPWVDESKYRFIERFKFYSHLAWTSRNPLAYPLKILAQLRCATRFFRFPIEKKVIESLFRPQKLS